MYIHNFLRKVNEEEKYAEEVADNQGLIGSLKQYVFSYSPKPFYYNIGGENYNLDEIKHGLLRSNTKAPAYYMRSMSSTDPRLNLLRDHWDQRINFVCLDYPDFLEHIDPFDGSSSEKLDECLDQFVSEIINAKVEIDIDQGEISLPQVLDDYKADFGNTEDNILAFVFHYLEEQYEFDTILK